MNHGQQQTPVAAERAPRPTAHPTGLAPADDRRAGDVALARARRVHPAGTRRRHLSVVPDLVDEAGSLVAEYGLLVVLGATITMLATKWATGGAIWQLFGAVLSRARALVGA